MKLDTLLNSGLALEYNIVLVNRDGSTSLSALKTKISLHVPDFNKNTLLVFDRDNALLPLDQGQAPYFIFLNKNMEITSKLSGYKVSIVELKNQLKLIE